MFDTRDYCRRDFDIDHSIKVVGGVHLWDGVLQTLPRLRAQIPHQAGRQEDGSSGQGVNAGKRGTVEC